MRPVSEIALSLVYLPATYAAVMPVPNEKMHVLASVAVQGVTAAASVPVAKDAQQISEAPSSRLRVALLAAVGALISDSDGDEPPPAWSSKKKRVAHNGATMVVIKKIAGNARTEGPGARARRKK